VVVAVAARTLAAAAGSVKMAAGEEEYPRR